MLIDIDDAKIERERAKTNFLDNFFAHGKYNIIPLLNDASFRTYDRVQLDDKSYILMNSPPQHYNLEPFINMAQLLNHHGFSVPEIHEIDDINGFMLIEDFGSLNIKHFLTKQDDVIKKEEIYKLAIDILLKLQSIDIATLDKLPRYDNSIFLTELGIYSDWYIPMQKGQPTCQQFRQDYISIWNEILSQLPSFDPCLVLRDYHVDNMMLLEREHINSIGILDFQDALIGHPIYDVVSLLEDARIDVEPQFASKIFNYYLSKSNVSIDVERAILSYNILAAQRNSKILGIFARKFIRDQQESYLLYIPRVLSYLRCNLSHEIFKPLKRLIELNI